MNLNSSPLDSSISNNKLDVSSHSLDGAPNTLGVELKFDVQLQNSKNNNKQNDTDKCTDSHEDTYKKNGKINHIKASIEDSHSVKSNASSSIKSNESHKMSINSLNLNDDDLCVMDSDSDEEFNNNNCTIRKLGEQSSVSENPINDVQIVKQNISKIVSNNNASTTLPDLKSQLNINHLSIAGNPTDVTVGNKYIFDGNVIIKQFVMEKKTTNGVNENLNDDIEHRNNKSNNLGTKTSTTNENVYKNSTFFEILANHLRSYRNILILSATIILLGIILGLIGWKLDKNGMKNESPETYNVVGDGDDFRKNIPIDSTISKDRITSGEILRLVTRSEWIAQPPNVDLVNLTLPVHRVIIAHTATEPCDTQAQCTFRVRFIQTFHIESRGFDDIAYNYLVGGDGAIYEGRGWDKVGAHTKGFNVGSICVAFIGTFNTIIPPDGQLNAVKLLILQGLRLGKISSDYKLYGHRQLIATESPGQALFQVLQKWPHFGTELASINPLKNIKQEESHTANDTVNNN